MVEGGWDKMLSKAAADWMNFSAELKDAELKTRDLQDTLEEANRDLAAARTMADELQAERNAVSGKLGDAARDKEQFNLALEDRAASLAAVERQMADITAELKSAQEKASAFLARVNDLEGELKAEKEAGGAASDMVIPALGLLSLVSCFLFCMQWSGNDFACAHFLCRSTTSSMTNRLRQKTRSRTSAPRIPL